MYLTSKRVRKRDSSIKKSWLELKFDILIIRVDNQGRTPLWIASLAGSLELVELLYNSGSVVDQVGHVGTTALSAAAQGRYSMLLRISQQLREILKLVFSLNS